MQCTTHAGDLRMHPPVQEEGLSGDEVEAEVVSCSCVQEGWVVVCGGVVWCGVVWCGVVWCGVVWCGVVV